MMKTLPNSRLVLATAVLTVLFAAGCERRAPDATGTAPAESPAMAPTESPASSGVTPAPVSYTHLTLPTSDLV